MKKLILGFIVLVSSSVFAAQTTCTIDAFGKRYTATSTTVNSAKVALRKTCVAGESTMACTFTKMNCASIQETAQFYCELTPFNALYTAVASSEQLARTQAATECLKTEGSMFCGEEKAVCLDLTK